MKIYELPNGKLRMQLEHGDSKVELRKRAREESEWVILAELFEELRLNRGSYEFIPGDVQNVAACWGGPVICSELYETREDYEVQNAADGLDFATPYSEIEKDRKLWTHLNYVTESALDVMVGTGGPKIMGEIFYAGAKEGDAYRRRRLGQGYFDFEPVAFSIDDADDGGNPRGTFNGVSYVERDRVLIPNNLQDGDLFCLPYSWHESRRRPRYKSLQTFGAVPKGQRVEDLFSLVMCENLDTGEVDYIGLYPALPIIRFTQVEQ